MFECPRCYTRMARVKNDHGVFWNCAKCKGKAIGMSGLRKTSLHEYVNHLWKMVREDQGRKGCSCPSCHKAMIEVFTSARGKQIPVDVCKRCQFIWFDAGELESIPAKEPEKPLDVPFDPKQLPMEAREALAEMEFAKHKRKQEAEETGFPDEWWQILMGLVGLPVEHSSDPVRDKPVVTWGLTAIVIAISVLAFFVPRLFTSFALIPDKAFRYGGLTLITAFFLHGGVLHLIGNMYFLLVFGDNVEDYLGKGRYILLILCASFLGSIAHILGDPRSAVPCIGASDGISGIIAFYALRFPHSRLGVLILFRWVRISALTALIIWLLLQFFGAWQQLGGFSNVSSLSHLGGAAVGVIFWLLFKDDPTRGWTELPWKIRRR